ncbi:MAG: 3-deoxy-D-manno-octulosonic acid transferase [Pirellulales bacterium]
MPYLLNLIYLLLLLLAAPWLVWSAWRKGKYRRGWAEKFFGRVPISPDDGRPCVWLHGVSVGEVNLLPMLVRAITERHPGWRCVISTTTRTGMDLARRRFPEYTVFHCPLDFTWATAAAMRRLRPDLLVLAELELWPNLIRAARRRGTRVAVINGRLSENSFRGYRRVRWLLPGLFARLDLVAVQDSVYAERFTALGVPADRVHVTGSMKFDGAPTDRDNPKTRDLAALAGFREGHVVFLAGSTQEPEERIALEVFQRLRGEYPPLRLVIVPRHPERFDEVARLLDRSGLPWRRRSELDAEKSDPPQADNLLSEERGVSPAARPPTSDVPHPTSNSLLVDTVGELGAWWGTAAIAYVGGSMGSRGGQNMIEPAAYGAAVSFGPNTRNFRDIVAALRRYDAAVVVQDVPALEAFVRRCLDQPDWAAAMGRRAQHLVLDQQGATDRTVELLGRALPRDPRYASR